MKTEASDWKPEFREPNEAFDDAIKAGHLSADANASNYAGNFMYMYSEEGKDFFKNSMTRKYLVVEWSKK